GLDRALNIAAKKAKIGNYRLLELPEQKEPFEQFMESLSTEVQLHFAKQQFGEYQEWYNQVKKATQYEGIQMRMPMKIDIH
ncbi:MAG: signal peptide peptidase SppA, partial [Bacteroidota bacterium]